MTLLYRHVLPRHGPTIDFSNPLPTIDFTSHTLPTIDFSLPAIEPPQSEGIRELTITEIVDNTPALDPRLEYIEESTITEIVEIPLEQDQRIILVVDSQTIPEPTTNEEIVEISSIESPQIFPNNIRQDDGVDNNNNIIRNIIVYILALYLDRYGHFIRLFYTISNNRRLS